MCLSTRFTPATEKKTISKLPNRLITVYRWVLIKSGGGYEALWTPYSFHAGINEATHSTSGVQKELNGLYKAGFHSYRTKAGAKWAGPNKCWGRSVLIKAKIRKEWITAIGKTGKCTVYVTDKIIAPSCRDKSAVVSLNT